ncbi:hypothetical protein Vadar_020510 [Vaccinium darrowii]|nr:hypothetical protein Vadar_020510 [Vaccinium darrowii]
MDISAASVKTPEPETEAQTRIQPVKQLLTTNGVLKRHHLNPPAAAAVVTYKECLKNHAATMGGHAVDGCGEFMLAPSSDPTNPTSLKCAACGCHRNFHRLDTDPPPPPPSSTHQIIEYKPHHRHHPPPPPPHHPTRCSPTKSNSASPPPISSSYMLLALSGGGGGGGGGGGLSGVPPQESGRLINHSGSIPGGRKRFRTKFSQNQKEKMLQFAERVGWKMQRKDEDLISGFCAEIGVEKGVFKVWMHNNKSTFAKNNINKLNHHHLLHHNNGNGVNFGNTATTVSSNFHNHQENNNNGSVQVSGQEEEGVVGNGSSSSS